MTDTSFQCRKAMRQIDLAKDDYEAVLKLQASNKEAAHAMQELK